MLQFTGEGDLSDFVHPPQGETSASTNLGTVLWDMLDEADDDEILVEALVRNADADR